jgi:hypothetical protein
MSKDLEPLDRDVLAVLGQLGPIDDVPSAARDRILRAVEARVAMVPGGGGGNGGAAATPAPSGGSWIARHPWVSLSAALAVGGAIGAGARGRPEVRMIPAQATVMAPAAVPASPSAPWTPVATPSTSAPPPQPSPPVARPVAPPPSENGGQELAAESALLDIARAAIARGEADHALAAVDRHASSFPHGVLREEREALGVKALVIAGRGDDARARAARFRTKYPESLFLPALESALRSVP